MELELKFTEVTGCEPVGDLVTTQEESMETAIPEYCPDMARIVDTVGQLRLREKHLTGQQLTVSGSVVLTVLYTSEESAGLRSLSMEVPFSCQVEDKRLMGCTAVCVAGRLLLAEARAVTARKLYLRVMPEFTVSGYANRRQRLCCGVGEDPALRVRRQETELELLTAVEEREFSFTQEAVPEGPPPEDVLMEQAAARVEECRRVGSRLVVKGQAEVCILYRGDNQELAAYRTALPFSQLLDGLDLPEDADVEARIPWVHSEARVLRTENGPAFGITVTVCAALFVRRRQQISCIEDLYSLRQVARVQRQETDSPAGVLAAGDPHPGGSAAAGVRPGPALCVSDGGRLRRCQRGAGGRQSGPAVYGAAAGTVPGRERDAGVRGALCGGNSPGVLGAADGPRRLRPAAAAIHRQCLPSGGTGDL